MRETVTINADPPPDPHPKRPPPAAAQAHPAHFSRNLFKTLRKIRPPNCRELSASGTQSRGAMKNPLLRSWVACGRETRFKIESKAAETRTKSQQNGGKNHEKQQFFAPLFPPSAAPPLHRLGQPTPVPSTPYSFPCSLPGPQRAIFARWGGLVPAFKKWAVQLCCLQDVHNQLFRDKSARPHRNCETGTTARKRARNLVGFRALAQWDWGS